MHNQSTSSPQNEQQCAADMSQPTSQGSTTQSGIQARGPGGPDTPPPFYFWTKLRPEGLKNFFGETGVPPYLRVWMTAPPPLISRSGFGTATWDKQKDSLPWTLKINSYTYISNKSSRFLSMKIINTLKVPVLWIFQHVFFETRTGDLSY